MRSIDEDLRALLRRSEIDETVGQLEDAARALVSMPPWMARSIDAVRSAPPDEGDRLRQAAREIAGLYDLAVTFEGAGPRLTVRFTRAA